MPTRIEGASPTERFLQQQVDELKRDNMELERRLHELSEEKRRLEIDLKAQHEAFLKMQAREQDLSKDIEVLRDENSHHTGAITRLQDETEGLKGENDNLRDDLTTAKDKLNKTEKCYKEVEHENLSLEAEIEQLVSDKKRLFEEKQKLQVAVEDALKTKENYRSTIKQLREQNQSLESLVRTPGNRIPKPEKKRVVVAVATKEQTKEQKTLGEVMNLREEKVQLQGRLLFAQQEIDSLEAHLKVHEEKYPPGEDLNEEVAYHLARFQVEMGAVRSELESAQNAIVYFSSQQQALVHESFLMLVDRCREYLSVAENNKDTLSEALALAESSLSKLSEDYELLKDTNSKLHTQRSAMQDEVISLKEEVSALNDQKRLQSIQISLNETLSREREEKIAEMEIAQSKLKTKHSSSEKIWKKELSKVEMEWEVKVAEINQKCDFLLDEKETLLTEKYQLEVKLAEVVLDNTKLTVTREEFESRIKDLEERMVLTTLKVDEYEREVCKARDEIATLLVQKVCLSAQMQLDRQEFEDKLEGLNQEKKTEISHVLDENRTLNESVESVQDENAALMKRLEDVSGKEKHIGILESKISVLLTNQDHLQSEMDSLMKKHASVLDQFQLLEESEHSRRLDNEKLKMTLSTEIKLLKSKLTSVEKERNRFKAQLLEAASRDPQKSSAFHSVGNINGGSKHQVEQLKKHIAALQSESKQQRKLNLEVSGTRNSQVADLQSRLSHLEAENIRLKESTSLKTSAPSSRTGLDEETTANLRKRVVELTRKTFFLESDKQNLTDKVRSLTTNLKSAREAKDHATSDKAQTLQVENKSLRERIHKLEGNLTKKLMAADSKIVETVNESDKLKSKLLKVQSALSSEQRRSSSLDSLLSLLKNESKILLDLKTTLTASSEELEMLEVGHQRIENLQQDMQLSLGPISDLPSPEERDFSTSSMVKPVSVEGSLPSVVLKSLPVGYPSNLQEQNCSDKTLLSRSESLGGCSAGTDSGGDSGTAGSNSSGVSVSAAGSGGGGINHPILHRKLSEINTATLEFSENLHKHKSLLQHKGKEVSTIQERLADLEDKFRFEAERSYQCRDILESIKGLDLQGTNNLQEVMQQQIEKLQDQVSLGRGGRRGVKG